MGGSDPLGGGPTSDARSGNGNGRNGPGKPGTTVDDGCMALDAVSERFPVSLLKNAMSSSSSLSEKAYG